jgi:hypothetical protein
VLDHLMTEIDPLFARYERHQFTLDLLRRATGGQTQSPRQTLDVGIDNDSGRDSKRRAQNDVRRFSSNAGQRRQ